jgi:hypothetical protein
LKIFEKDSLLENKVVVAISTLSKPSKFSTNPQRTLSRVLARIIFKRTKNHVATTMTCHLGEILLVKNQKQAFSFNKREAKVYCYAFLHVLKRDTCIILFF